MEKIKNLFKKLDTKNPIIRNAIVIIGIILGLVTLGLVASAIKAILGWVLALGWPILLTIAITTMLCGVIFGYVEIKSHGYVVDEFDDDEEDEDEE